jgi:hypothetical protein
VLLARAARDTMPARQKRKRRGEVTVGEDRPQNEVPQQGPASEAGVPQQRPASERPTLREDEVTEQDRLDEGDLSESERLPGDK